MTIPQALRPQAIKKIAIIGSGFAGIAAARWLNRAGHEVEIFDKGRAPGGRAATRWSPNGMAFHNYGAPCFSIPLSPMSLDRNYLPVREFVRWHRSMREYPMKHGQILTREKQSADVARYLFPYCVPFAYFHAAQLAKEAFEAGVLRLLFSEDMPENQPDQGHWTFLRPEMFRESPAIRDRSLPVVHCIPMDGNMRQDEHTTPGPMSSFLEFCLDPLPASALRQGTAVRKIVRSHRRADGDASYALLFESSSHPGELEESSERYDAVVVTVPAPQVAPLVRGYLPTDSPFLDEDAMAAMYDSIATIRFQTNAPTAETVQALGTSAHRQLFANQDIDHIPELFQRSDQTGDRTQPSQQRVHRLYSFRECSASSSQIQWVAHASPRSSVGKMNRRNDVLIDHLVRDVTTEFECFDRAKLKLQNVQGHRWRYGVVSQPFLATPSSYDTGEGVISEVSPGDEILQTPKGYRRIPPLIPLWKCKSLARGLVLAGDYFSGPFGGDAFASGIAAAESVRRGFSGASTSDDMISWLSNDAAPGQLDL
ncbi:uncharacterized protein MONBRDRAFT_32752 [Monosiga brevicollis MX1]|uniref:Amine oxidase domain-containing protein n=1 Tax=Monosiga brevicollis TaxID=81824 RepID=A9V1H5_MONBE|nr:uncharacterized protein MONBRDRAFT_32752 [Monosiga brevicollis MX1]EDQ88567.1 predicted protein [Monosiga brevicollis MX1]|eukprot:XP_001746671.1 hypothetical protein [Monosiga brevicollis MX1]